MTDTANFELASTEELLVVPTNIAATAVSDIQIDLTWTDNADGNRYIIWANSADDFGTATKEDIAYQGEQTGSIKGLSASTKYYAWVQTIAANGDLGETPTTSVSATTQAPSGSSPDAPTDLTVTSQTDTSVILIWTVGANTTGQEVMRATFSSAGVLGAWTKINDVAITTENHYIDTSVNSTPDPVTGSSYAYAIKPLNGTLEGDWSNTVFATFETAVSRIPGDMEDDLAASFFSTNDFAESVIWTKFGGSPVTITVMYDAESTTVDPETGDIVTSNPLITGATKDLEGAGNRDTFTISGQVFRVREVMPDGSGLTTVTLTKGK